MWQELVGLNNAFTGLEFSLDTVAAGVEYTFRLRAQNIHGWSDYSAYTVILTASTPQKMAILRVIDGIQSETAIRVEFDLPDSRGSPLIRYDFDLKGKDGQFYSLREHLEIEVPI